MTRARDLRPGDVIKISGRKVTVDAVRTGAEEGGMSIRWSRGSTTGIRAKLKPDAEVKRIYRKPGWRW